MRSGILDPLKQPPDGVSDGVPDGLIARSAFRNFSRTTSTPMEQVLIEAPSPPDIAPLRAPVAIPLDSGNRLFDVAIALVLLAALLPVMVLVAGLIVLTDRGPVFYAHRRVGQDGRHFRCFKFRTMVVNANAGLEQLFAERPDLKDEWEQTSKLANDPRITRIGSFLRLSSIDELPQLFNVLRGDMSVVGPRPIVDSEVERYGRYAPHYLSVKPGLTGMWQVSGRSSTTFRRRVAADVYYVRNKSVLLDLWILLATVPAVLFAKGAY